MIEMGEPVDSVANHLESGLIRDAESFRTYLVYSGWIHPYRRVIINSARPCRY